MAYTINLEEVLQIAVQIEKNGEMFYASAVDTGLAKNCEDVFRALCKQEKQHELLFSSWLSDTIKQSDTIEPAEDSLIYIKAFADNHVFSVDGASKEALKKLKSVNEILNYALNAESASILLYTELKQLLPVSSILQIDKIINEEKSHYLHISSLLKQV